MQKVAAIACLGVVAAERTIEVVSSDLTSGGAKVLDNIRGKWQQSLKFMGAEANLETEYDRNAREDFLKEATLSGKVDDVNYELRTEFGDSHELTLTTNTKDGTALEINANNKDGLTNMKAARDVKIQGQDVNVEASHERKSSTSKVKLSSVLGHGVSGSATWTVGNKLDSADMEIEYASDISDGRSLSATVNPRNGAGDVEYVDSKTLDATVTAAMDLGGKPKLSVKRAWSF